MINSKTTLQFILAGILFVSIAVTGCNNGSKKTETKTDSVSENSMEIPMVPEDTITKKIIETAKTRPVVPPN